MDFYVFDQDYTLLGILASPISVTYTEKYNDLGDFQVNLPVDEINRELIKSDNVILFDRIINKNFALYLDCYHIAIVQAI